VAELTRARASLLATASGDPLVMALRFWLLLAGAFLALLAGGQLAGDGLLRVVAPGRARPLPTSRVRRLAGATVAGLAPIPLTLAPEDADRGRREAGRSGRWGWR
jgi:hypothetical protein